MRENESADNHAQRRKFDALYEAHGLRLYRFCLRLCGGQTEDAEDLAQEALVAAFKGLPRFAGRARLSTYLYACAVGLWRKRRSRPTLDIRPPPQEMEIAAPDFLPARLERITIDAALCALPDELREAFLLVKAEGLTHREAARVLNAPMGTVQWRVHEAGKRLRIHLTDKTDAKEKENE